jgi:hypothetical protein
MRLSHADAIGLLLLPVVPLPIAMILAPLLALLVFA